MVGGQPVPDEALAPVAGGQGGRPAISIVIPVLNDGAALAECLDAIDAADFAGVRREVIVVDGATCSFSRALCERHGATYLQSAAGRGVQMNHGARHANGAWYWFLHADCKLPGSAPGALDTCRRKGRARWGAFRHRVDHPSPVVRVIEWFDYLRSIAAALPYGDQGIFVERQTFEAVGGYREEPILEDVMLCEALARLSRPCILDPVILTSARRIRRLGILKTTAINWRVIWMYYRGVRDFAALRRYYNQ